MDGSSTLDATMRITGDERCMMSKPRIWILAHQHFRSLDQLNQVSIAQHSGNFWIGSLDALHTISKGAWDFMALEFFCFLHPLI